MSRLEWEDALRAELEQVKKRLQEDPSGSDKIDELEQALQFMRARAEAAEADNAVLRDALSIADCHNSQCASAENTNPTCRIHGPLAQPHPGSVLLERMRRAAELVDQVERALRSEARPAHEWAAEALALLKGEP